MWKWLPYTALLTLSIFTNVSGTRCITGLQWKPRFVNVMFRSLGSEWKGWGFVFLNHSCKEAPVFRVRVSMYSAVINRFRIDSYQVCSQHGTKSVLLNKVVTSNSAVFSEWLLSGYVTFNSSKKGHNQSTQSTSLCSQTQSLRHFSLWTAQGYFCSCGLTKPNSMAWFCIKWSEAFDDLGRSKSIMKFVASTFNNQFFIDFIDWLLRTSFR